MDEVDCAGDGGIMHGKTWDWEPLFSGVLSCGDADGADTVDGEGGAG